MHINLYLHKIFLSINSTVEYLQYIIILLFIITILIDTNKY